MWRLRWTSQGIVAAFLFVSASIKAREKLSKLGQIEMEANSEAERNWMKIASLLTNEVIWYDSSSDYSSDFVRSNGFTLLSRTAGALLQRFWVRQNQQSR